LAGSYYSVPKTKKNRETENIKSVPEEWGEEERDCRFSTIEWGEGRGGEGEGGEEERTAGLVR
jgi:hypothetical protein